MIRINTQTLAATRESIPQALQGLTNDTLTNLQTALKPVPPQFLGMEWWPEVDTSPPLAQYQRYGDETLTANATTKTVSVTRAILAWSAVEIAAELVAAQEVLQASILTQTQERLDTFAKTRGYDGILSACTYATDPAAKFAAEGQYAVVARSATWSALYALLAEVKAGTKPMPTSFADVVLPVLVWPA